MKVEVQRFMGLTNYFRRFIRDYAQKARPLYNLLKKAVTFQFDDTCRNAFNRLKSELTSYPVLRLYNPTAETELHTDASAAGFAAILLQKHYGKEWAPIAYYSQATNDAETRYHSFELEMLAMVKAIERFHVYLYGIEFKVITDCNALVHSVNKANLNPRIARWILKLQNYRFSIVHRAGHRMSHALSRHAGYIDSLPLERELEFKQLSDDKLRIIAQNLEFRDDDKFQLIDGLVYRKFEDKPRFVIPDTMIRNIISVYHDNMAHCGPEKTYQGIFANYWFPSMRKKIYDYINNCLTCLTVNISTRTREGELQLSGNSTKSLQCLHIDHFGPLPETEGGFRHILIIVDAFTRFAWMYP